MNNLKIMLSLAGSLLAGHFTFAQPDTVNNLDQKNLIADQFVLKNQFGKAIRFTLAEDGHSMPVLRGSERAADRGECGASDFRGHARAHAKTTRVRKTPVLYKTLPSFLKALESDRTMQTLIKRNSGRHVMEKKSVVINKVYLKAFKIEEDNDYHLILCDKNQKHFFNAEISAIKNDQSLTEVRNYFESYFEQPCGSKYFMLEDPLETKIYGSLFYDIDHKPGVVGPKGYRPKTAWEIHPVTDLTFR